MDAVLWVEIQEAYWLAETEVTNAQHERFDPAHEREWPGDDDPVTGVTWDEARAYCDWLAKRGSLAVRLPTEAEWEHACRAGSESEFCFGDDEARLPEYGWFDDNSGDRAHAVKTKRANAWGLHDLHGNVWEWCEDTYHQDYKGSPEDARAWTEGGEVWGRLAVPGRPRRGLGRASRRLLLPRLAPPRLPRLVARSAPPAGPRTLEPSGHWPGPGEACAAAAGGWWRGLPGRGRLMGGCYACSSSPGS